MSRDLKRTLYQIHKWAGLLAAAIFLCQATTGLMLAFKWEIRALDKGAFAASDADAPLPLDSIVMAATGALSEGDSLNRIEAPHKDGFAYLARITRHNGALGFATIDPTTGTIIRNGGLAEFPIETALFLHDNLLLDGPGRIIIAVQGLLVLAMAATGLILWWPMKGRFFKLGFKIAWRAPYPRFIFDLHRVPGALASAIVAFMAITGIFIALRAQVAAALPGSGELIQRTLEAKTDLSIEDAVALAESQIPQSRLKDVRFSDPDFEKLRIVLRAPPNSNPRAVHQVWIDRSNSSEITIYDAAKRSSEDVFLDWMIPLHTGEFASLPGRLLFTLAGFGFLVMTVTGLLLWWKRHQMRRPKPRPTAAE